MLCRPWAGGGASTPFFGRPVACHDCTIWVSPALKCPRLLLSMTYNTPSLPPPTNAPNYSYWRWPHASSGHRRLSRGASSTGLRGGNGDLFRDAGCLAVPRARSVVGTGDIFGDRLTQPIHILRHGVRLSKRHCDAGFVEGIEDSDPQIRACA